MQVLDYLFILLFVILILVVGIVFARVGGKDMKSFFAAGGALPWPISGLSLFMGFFSAGTFVVWGSIAYSLGWVSVTIQWTMAVAGVVVGVLIATKWHKTKILTVAEYITVRLGMPVQKMYTYLFLLVSLFTSGSFLYPVARIVEVSTGLSLVTSIIVLGVICIIYVSIGGLWAVVITDVLQFIVLTAAVFIVVPLSFDRVGDIQTFVNAVPDHFFDWLNGEYTLGFIIAFGIYNIIFLGGNWAYVQRYTSVGKVGDARKVGILFGLLYIISPVLWMIPPMLYRVVNPGLSGLNDEGAYLLMCKEVLPAGMLGMMLGGMIFATASSLNSTLNISSGVFTNDIYKLLYPKSSDKQLIRVARISTIVFGMLAILVALLVPLMGGIVNTVISVAAITGVPLYLPVIWTLFSRRQTGTSVLITTLSSLAINALFKFVVPVLFDLRLTRAEEMILGVAFPVVCLMAFEVGYRWKGKESGSPEIRSISGSESEDTLSAASGMNEANNKYSIRILGVGVLTIGLMITVLGMLASKGVWIVLTVGCVLMLSGFIILTKTTKKYDQKEV
ncbi:MAG: sodium transporter [Paludibacter sp. 47-17]|nr:MAG: sodium transporter [Paludibacter sp. 47-17]